MNFGERLNRKGTKKYFYYDLGRVKGKRPSTGIFIYTNPKTQVERDHNKEAKMLLEVKKSQVIIEMQAIGTPFIPQHKFKENFLDFFDEYVKNHKKDDNRHLPCCFTKFKKFIKKDFISPLEITEDFCKLFRQYLLDRLTGETPQNYFARFKWVVNAATKAKYFIENPVEKVSAKANPSKALKEIVEVEEYYALLATPCHNEELSHAFIFCLYTGLRWVDVKKMAWSDIKENSLTTRMIQSKTGQPVIITLHPIALKIIEKQRKKLQHHNVQPELVFYLPTADGANKMLGIWAKDAGVNKKITWSCARLSFSVLLQDVNVDTATVAYLLGHTTTKQVERAYKRHRPKDQRATVNKLPSENQGQKKISSYNGNINYPMNGNWALLYGGKQQL